MIENVGRKITLILSLLAIGVLAMAVGRFNLGLDLRGGTRMEYRLPIQEAVEDGTITREEANNPEALIAQFIEIIRKRIDPTGVKEPRIVALGHDRVVIELPGEDVDTPENLVLQLQEGLTATTTAIKLVADTSLLEQVPGSGTIEINGERIFFDKRDGNTLRVPADGGRGYGDTPRAEHLAGASVKIIESDPFRTLIENVGQMKFFIQAQREDFQARGTDESAQRRKATEWIAANPDTSIEGFNRLPEEQGGPMDGLNWYPMAHEGEGAPPPLESRIRALITEQDPNWQFTGTDIQSVGQSNDSLGYPAVGITMVTGRASNWRAFTGEHEDLQMAIVLNDEVISMPNIKGALPQSFIIEGGQGGFTLEEVQRLVTVLRSGSLKIKPILESQERVGATLGDTYVRRGALSAMLGLLFVLVFTTFYYRKLGLFACVSLVANLVLLMGAMAFLQATLTLPGVAGIILTVGMAVDANILIYERIREEALRGRKPLEAAKDGFQNALSTIVDANLTTLITALILYKLGSGPVRGFATTLSIGIVTSMFSALVITRVLVHLSLEKGVEPFKMQRWIQETKIPFMAMARKAALVSGTLGVLGAALFISLPDQTKLGIDFLGGAELTVRTEAPQPVDTIREKVAGIAGVIGDSSEVKAIANSASGDGFTQFRISFKTTGDPTSQTEASSALKDSFEADVRSALEGLLERGPFDVSLVTGQTDASGTLYFEVPHPEAGISDKLTEIGLSDVTLTRVEGPTAAYAFTGTCGLDKTQDTLSDQIDAAFSEQSDGMGGTFVWARPIPETSVVGPQVVSELRNSAIVAILLSLFAAVMYIRVRFAEYSFGLAAVTALVHDVLLTLGALAVAMATGIIQVEINLPMIAAFLTIIGYSLNDTIVVFDRVRENIPRSKGSLAAIIDKSINQTLARTMLTSMTTMITVLILLIFNLGSRNVLEGFAFALMIGVLVGTYSSMFIATPMLLFLETRRQKAVAEAEAAEAAAGKQSVGA